MKMFGGRWFSKTGYSLFDYEAKRRVKRGKSKGRATFMKPEKVGKTPTGLFTVWSYTDTRPQKKGKK